MRLPTFTMAHLSSLIQRKTPPKRAFLISLSGDLALGRVTLIDMGVDGIITDYPDRLREVMAEKKMALP
jgi:hypothetical protein